MVVIAKRRVRSSSSSHVGRRRSRRLNKVVDEDRLSSFSDEIIINIISHLPINSAAATSVLSHRWRHLWTEVTRFEFYHDDWKEHDSEKFAAVLVDVLGKLTSPILSVFRLHLNDLFDLCTPDSVEYCFRHVCFRHVKDLLLLLQHFPNLKKLKVDMNEIAPLGDMVWSALAPDCLSKLKKVEISGLTGIHIELQLLAYILCNSTALEKLQVYVTTVIEIKLEKLDYGMHVTIIGPCFNFQGAPELVRFLFVVGLSVHLVMTAVETLHVKYSAFVKNLSASLVF